MLPMRWLRPVIKSVRQAILQAAGHGLGLDPAAASEAEFDHQETVLARYGDLSGVRVRLPTAAPWAIELAHALDMTVDPTDIPVPIPDPAPVGTAGIARLLARWRRAV